LLLQEQPNIALLQQVFGAQAHRTHDVQLMVRCSVCASLPLHMCAPCTLQHSAHYQYLLTTAQNLTDETSQPLYDEARQAMYDEGRPALGQLLILQLLTNEPHAHMTPAAIK
jgi:hypothetical protein